MKTCTRCNSVLPATEFYPRRNRASLSSICKTCSKERVRLYRQTDGGAETARRAAATYAATTNGQAKRAAWEKSEKRQAYVAEYAASELGKAAQLRANKSEAGRARAKRYFATEKGRAAIKRKHHVRRALADQRPTLTAEEWSEIRAAYGNRCAYCGTSGPLTQDHVVPVVKGGTHSRENVVPACRRCNGKKGAHDLPTDLLGTAALFG